MKRRGSTSVPPVDVACSTVPGTGLRKTPGFLLKRSPPMARTCSRNCGRNRNRQASSIFRSTAEPGARETPARHASTCRSARRLRIRMHSAALREEPSKEPPASRGKKKKSRATLAARRNAARAQLAAASTRAEKQRIARRLASMKWVHRSKNAGGSFFGTIKGIRGYWQRPERSLAVAPRRNGVSTVIPKGRNKPRLLLAFANRAEYRPLFRYNDTINRVTAANLTSAAFARELARVQSRRPTP